MARRSQQSSVLDDRRDRLPPHYKEAYRLAIDALVEQGRDGFREFLQREGTAPFLSEPEVDHIERTFQSPALATRGDNGDGGDGGGGDDDEEFDSLSSGTYWPVYSDTSAPDLELGWPAPGRFLGQTNVTIYFHPPLGDGVPTIKEVIRRHIRGACKVVAVVMDVFTDVDIFQELLEAATVRRVPVYLLHDRLNFPLFHRMCVHHGLRPSDIENVRVRTLPGSPYYCKSGAKFHGQVFEKFMLFDCVTALCGSYSLTWSHEKIHRSLVHEFTGEMVDTFDEEFRILYAQSSCPYDDGDSRAVAVPASVPPAPRVLPGLRGGALASHALQVNKHDSSVDSWVSSASSRRALEQRTLNFARHDVVRHSVDKTYSRVDAGQLQREDRYTFVAKQDVLSDKDYRGVANVSQRFVANAHVFSGEREVWKRFSYAGEAMESHAFVQRTQDPYSFAAGRPGALDLQPRNVGLSGQELRRLQAGVGAYGERGGDGLGEDVFRDGGAAFPDPARNVKRIAAEETREVFQQHQIAPYSQRKRSEFPAQHLMNSRREAWQAQPGKAESGRSSSQQTFVCQTSPTQTHFQEDGAFSKAGAGKTRESVDAGGVEKSAKQGLRRWRINSFLSSCENPSDTEAKAEDEPKFDGEERCGESAVVAQEGGRGSPVADAIPGFADGLTRHESLRSKINPMLQRNSRLRSSLIFKSARQDTGGLEQIARQGAGNVSASAAVDIAADAKPPEGARTSERGAGEAPAEAPAGGSSTVDLKPKDVQATATLPLSDFQAKYGPKEPFVRSRFLFNSVTSRKTTVTEEVITTSSDKTSPVAKLDSHIKELFPKLNKPVAEVCPAPPANALSKLNVSPLTEQTNVTKAQQRNETIPAPPKSGVADAGAWRMRATDQEPSGAPQDVKLDQASSKVSPAVAERTPRLQSFLDKVGKKEDSHAEGVSTTAPQASAVRESPSPRDACRPSPPAASPTAAKVSPVRDAAPSASRSPAAIVSPDLSSAPAWRSTPTLYGSNLKDDTKLMLEQISMTSHKYKDDNHKAMQEVAHRSDLPGKLQDAAGGGSTVASPTEAAPGQSAVGPATAAPAEEDKSDELIRNLESKRKENRAYSRFEVFYKMEGAEVKPKVVSPLSKTPNVPDQSGYGSDKYRTRELPSSNSLLQKIKVSFKSKN